MSRAFLLCVVCLGCVSCASPWMDRLRSRDPVPEGSPERASSTPAAPSSAEGEASARSRVAEAEALTTQTRQLVGGWSGADPDLAAAHGAIEGREWSGARAAGDEAIAHAEQAISDHYARLANEELARSYAYSGLDDGQLLQLRAAEEIMVTGNSRLAYGRLRTLNQQLEKGVKTYTVRAGDSLWVIAGRPEVYSNSLLWPLVWQSNATIIPNPDRLRRGEVLKVRAHPSADEIGEAVSVARGERKAVPGVTPEIGEIREAPSP